MKLNSQQNSADHSRWSPTGRQVLATIATVVALGSLSLIGHSFGWWSGAGQHAWVVGLAVVFLVAMIILIRIGYRKKMTGFGDKTLWNWLELLIIPVVLAVGGLLFTVAQDEIRWQVMRDLAEDPDEPVAAERMTGMRARAVAGFASVRGGFYPLDLPFGRCLPPRYRNTIVDRP